MTEVEIRHARPLEDAPAVIEHVRAVCSEPDTWVVTTPEEFDLTVEQEVHFLRNLDGHATSACWIATAANGDLAGMLMARGGDRLRNQHVVNLGMSVAAEHRNRGIGRALLETCLAWARGHALVRRVELSVICENAPALHLYRSLGFEVEGLQRGVYLRHGRLYDQFGMSVLL